jgi:hypothetical protein
LVVVVVVVEVALAVAGWEVVGEVEVQGEVAIVHRSVETSADG